MLIAVWSVIMPLLTALLSAAILYRLLFCGRNPNRHLRKALEVVMSEKERERSRENKATLYVMDFLPRVQNLLDVEQLVLADMKSMLALMGSQSKAEKELAVFIVKGFTGALPILAVPVVTGFVGYFALYPVFAVILTVQQYAGLKKKYRKWQLEVKKDLPELIDKLRISFASGRDYISAFHQAKSNSGVRMKTIIEKLINDLQCMRPAQALDLFAESFKMPVVTKFASAVKIAIEHGYENAENYFKIIETDITEIRKIAIEEITKSKPEKVYQLYLVIISLAVGSLVLKGWEIFSQINKIM